MISPFTIYLILMLDNIRGAIGIMTFVFAVVVLAGVITTLVNAGQEYSSDKTYFAIGKKILWFSTPILALMIAGLALLPNTKQAAVIFLVPAIANNENVQREASELYDLAKQGLKNLVTPEKEPQQ